MAAAFSLLRRNRKLDDLRELVRPCTPIDVDLLARLPSLPLRARYLVESFLTGRHRSPIKGTAPEFAEYRTYQAGDDLRRIDWRLYGRSDRLQVKQFEDENQLRVCLALDLSASMRYGSRPQLMSKLDFSRTVLAALAMLIRRQHDAVGLALIGERTPGAGSLMEFMRPGSSATHHQHVFAGLDQPPEARSADLPDALRRLATLLHGGGLVVLASDFYVDVKVLSGVFALYRSQRIELVALQVLDPLEVEFGDALAGRFVDLESGERRHLNTRAVREGYLRRFRAHQKQLAECCLEHAVHFMQLRTDGNPLDALANYMARRTASVR